MVRTSTYLFSGSWLSSSSLGTNGGNLGSPRPSLDFVNYGVECIKRAFVVLNIPIHLISCTHFLIYCSVLLPDCVLIY